MNQFRIFVEKQGDFATESFALKRELNESLKLDIQSVRLINSYDCFNLSKEELEIAKGHVFSEVVTDEVFDVLDVSGKIYFAIEFLPGQYDQRADSAEQCLTLLTGNEAVKIKSGKVFVFEGITFDELSKIKAYLINPIECREKNLDLPLAIDAAIAPKTVEIYEGFITFSAAQLDEFLTEKGMAMTLADLIFIQDYFRDVEKRNPSDTELKVLDTYWSDHCRHTTFETVIKSVAFEEGKFQESLQNAFSTYLNMRKVTHRNQKNMTLMDMATINAREARQFGLLEDLEITDEINACSIYIDVDVDGKKEPWLLMFKNETHNHPTEIEPFGGASTCIGGAIRDPLSGRSYVYQAMRISGGANILEPIESTRTGKLAQKLISKNSARGNSSYGNQIGLATSFVRELYHPGFKAKHLETGAVVAAAPVANVRRDSSDPGDKIILLGGATGRDGIGGATGSSKSHTVHSVETASSEVQKGNAPTERKIQRLFREQKVTTLIKKCNDFGAGGVAVAIGELADGLLIDLDKVPVKYQGLNGSELAISESQERMAVVVAPSDVEAFIHYAEMENLNAVVVAEVTDTNRLVMTWQKTSIVDISRDFLNTNGAKQEIGVQAETEIKGDPFARPARNEALKTQFLDHLKQDNVASLQGMIESFDATIGGTTVLMPFGGKYQLTETEGSVHKIPVRHGKTNTASLLTFGYNPDLSAWSPFHGAAYAVVESMAKIVALGGKWQGIRFSFQEYFERLGHDPEKWGKPFAALLGAIQVQHEFGLAAIGGKDSMSGTFEELTVPPTLISFAVQTADARQIISSELKAADHYLYLIKHTPKADFMPDTALLSRNFDFIHHAITSGDIVSSFVIKEGGLAEGLAKMSFGNKIGLSVVCDQLFDKNIGSIVVESRSKLDFEQAEFLGMTTAASELEINGEIITIDEAISAWQGKFSAVYPVVSTDDTQKVAKIDVVSTDRNQKSTVFRGQPQVFIPVFPGTNCEYDSARAFEAAGAKTKISVFRNQSARQIEDSIDEFAKQISASQILMLSGGFSAGDEPDGSGKFITTVLMNEKIRVAVEDLLSRDGLILGICNGFQALIKSGLLPYGKFGQVTKNSPTLVRNNSDRHQSKIVRTRMTGAKSPWLQLTKTGEIQNVAISHGEGKFVATSELLSVLTEKGQVISQYVDQDNVPTMDERYNPNGSVQAIEGIISEDGHILGKMGHSERMGQDIFKNVIGEYDQKIFEAGVNYFLNK